MDPRPAVLVGCGPRGQQHARALTDSDRYDLRAVCDLDADRARETAAAFDVPAWHTDLDAAVESGGSHLSVATPPTVRLELLRDCIAHDPATLLFEKPIANDFDEALAVADLVADADARVGVCHQHVYGREVAQVREWLDAGRVGAPDRIVATTKGGLVEHGAHLFHALDWLVGATPGRVRASASGAESLSPEGGATDAVEPTDVTVELSYPDDTRAFCHLGPEAPDVEGVSLDYRADAVGPEGRTGFVLGHRATLAGTGEHEQTAVPGFDPDGTATRRLYDDLAAVAAGEPPELAGVEHPFVASFGAGMVAHRTVEAAFRAAVEDRAVAPGGLEGGYGAVERLRERLEG